MTKTKTQSIIIKTGVIIWSLWLLVNYLIHHPSIFYAITQPPYFSVIITLLFICLGASLYIFSKKTFVIRGWKVYFFTLLMMMIIYQSFISEGNLFTGSLFKHQFFFLINTILLHLGTFFIFMCCYTAGNRLLSVFNNTLTVHHKNILSVALGMVLVTFLLFVLGTFGWLKTLVLVPFIAVLLIWQRKACWSFITYTFWKPIDTKKTSPWTFVLVMIILIFTAFNLIGAMKVFPIGYDSARLYQNLTKNILESQALIQGGQAYNWSLFTTIGPLLFKSMTFSIFTSHAVGLLCLWAMYHLGRIFLSRFSTWLALALYYTLPALSFHHFEDAKVDLGFLFICLSIFLFILKFGASIQFDFTFQNKTTRRFFILLGLLLGFAMGIKYLAILLIIGVLLIFIYQWGGAKAYLGFFLFILSTLFIFQVNSFGYLEISPKERYLIAGVSFVLGLLVLGFYFKKLNWKKEIPLAKNLFILSVVSLFTFMPWMLKNTLESNTFSIKNVFYGKSSQHNLKHDYSFLLKNNIPFTIQEKDKQQVLEYLGKKDEDFNIENSEFVTVYKDMKKAVKSDNAFSERKNTGKREEVLRYLGYEPGLNKYLSLPYDVTMGTNIPNKRGLNIGFIFLLFLPMLVLSFKKEKIVTLKNTIGVVTFILLFLISWNAVTYSETPLNINEYLTKYNPFSSSSLTSFGDTFYFPFIYIQNTISNGTQPLFSLFSKSSFPLSIFFLLGLCLLLVWIAKDNWKKFNTPVRILVVFIISYGFLWWILGNGIPYYALIIWLLGSLVIAYYFENIEDFFPQETSPFIKKWGQIVFAVFLIFNLFVHFSNKTNNWKDSKNIFFAPFMIHYSNKIIPNEELTNKKVILPIAAKVLNNNLSAKIYKVGTYMNYHIKENTSRVFEDDQLNIFDQTNRILQNPDDFLTVLKLNDVKYIVFSLKVASIDKTPEKSLVDKANRIVKVLNNKERIRLIMTDNKVSRYDPKTKKEKTGYGLVGKTVENGTMAIFEIL